MADKIFFRSAFGKFDIDCCHPGELTRPEYQDFVEENGYVSIKQIGEFDLDSQIQSCKEQSLVYNIIKLSQSDPGVLSVFDTSYADVRTDQISYSEHLQRAIALESSFVRLPFELRSQFNNDLSEFVSKLRSGEATPAIKNFIMNHQSDFIATPNSSSSESEVS